MSKTKGFHGRAAADLAARGEASAAAAAEFDHVVTHTAQLRYEFSPHFHAYASRLVSRLVAGGFAGLQAVDTESVPGKSLPDGSPRPRLFEDFFATRYDPETSPTAPAFVDVTDAAGNPYPAKQLDFAYGAGYSVYNWELFYHLPFTVALHLSREGRYEEAQRWFHFVFDPTDDSDGPTPQRFWKAKPLQLGLVPHIEDILLNLATGANEDLQRDTQRAIGAWRDQPLSPHLIARVRPSAYMYRTVMAYLDNLVAWGDSLFREDTRESINQALQLYMLAANILGPRPEAIPKRGRLETQTYASLSADLDAFGNAVRDLEAEVPFDFAPQVPPGELPPEAGAIEGLGATLYFCVPRNEKFLSYWDTLAQRLFNIRHSLDLEGTYRQLPTFAPPVDPGMLARAVAAGVDVGAVVSGADEPVGPVRFAALLQRALEVCQELKALGAQILSAIEKKDNEALGLLRARHESALAVAVEATRHGQLHEAAKSREAAQQSIRAAYERYAHYERLLGRTPALLPDWRSLGPAEALAPRLATTEPKLAAKPVRVDVAAAGAALAEGAKLNRNEAAELRLLGVNQDLQDAAAALDVIAASMNVVPTFGGNIQPFGVGATVSFGGSNIAAIFSAMSAGVRGLAGRVAYEANRTAKVGSYARREQEWAFQSNVAAAEVSQLFAQLRVAELREHVAAREAANHQLQMRQAGDLENFLTNERRKKTNEAFYLWAKREAQGLHAQYFQFAYDVARKAQAAFRAETNDPVPEFLNGRYLGGREGLFAGEKLYLDLKRMELAYLESRRREYELTKHVSLRDWAPLALERLRAEGRCEVEIPEQLFDIDAPGHYLRRIKSVALSLPCVTGPYASVHCALRLVSNRTRVKANLVDGTWYPQDPTSADDRFVDTPVLVSSVVTSTAQLDTGMFETNLRDDRPLPFEGAGAISRWSLELLDRNLHQFDHETIADAVLTIRYTARPGVAGELVAPEVAAWVGRHSARLFSARHEFSTAWARYRAAASAGGGPAELAFELDEGHFPLRMKGALAQARRIHFYVRPADATLSVQAARGADDWGTASIAGGAGSLAPSPPGSPEGFDVRGPLTLRFTGPPLDDLWLIFDWALEGG